MGEWLPSSGYQAADRMCYELYLNDNEKHPQRKFIVDICQPVKPMSPPPPRGWCWAGRSCELRPRTR